jgi:hypothetical protein
MDMAGDAGGAAAAYLSGAEAAAAAAVATPDETDLCDDTSIFENKAGLSDDMRFLASMPELCDVTFMVGETREPVCAVKAVLAARSKVQSDPLIERTRYLSRVLAIGVPKAVVRAHGPAEPVRRGLARQGQGPRGQGGQQAQGLYQAQLRTAY